MGVFFRPWERIARADGVAPELGLEGSANAAGWARTALMDHLLAGAHAPPTAVSEAPGEDASGLDALVQQVRQIAATFPGVRDAWICFQGLGPAQDELCRRCQDWYQNALGGELAAAGRDAPARQTGCGLVEASGIQRLPLDGSRQHHGFLLVAGASTELAAVLPGLNALAAMAAQAIDDHWRRAGANAATEGEREAAREVISAASPLLQPVIETMADGVFIKDGAGRYLGVNPAFEALSGRTTAEIIGRTDAELFPPDLATILSTGDHTVLATGGTRRGEHRIVRAGGAVLRIDLIQTAFRNAQGRLVGLVGIVRDVTEWHRRGDAVRMLWRAVDQSPASIVITDPDGIIEYANPGFVRTSGYQTAEAVGQTPRFLKSGQVPTESYRALWQTISAGQIWHGEFHNRRKDGSLYWVAASISPVRDDRGLTTHYIAVEEDITDIKLLQERLRQSEERYRGASEASLDGLFILDAIRDDAGEVQQFRIVEANRAGCTLLQTSRERLVGQDLDRAVPFAQPLGLHARYREVYLSRKPLDEQIEIPQAPLKGHWLHQTVAPTAEGIAITWRDVTSLKNYEAALKAARVAAEQANAAKSVFLATMSHELRTPLNAILGFSELIRDEAFGPVGTERYADYAADIHASGQHLLELITAILDLSKIEAGKLEINPRPFDLKLVLGNCLHLLTPRADQANLSLIGDWSETLPKLCADERAVRQIVLNLLSNAVKFTPGGGTVQLQARVIGSVFEISVSDTGVGIPADHMERVLRPFEQLENSYSRGAGGTGLGLALVKALTELHGGTVTITSRLRQGTMVSIRLPQATAPQATAPQATAPQATAKASPTGSALGLEPPVKR
jgi:PAS domain S-box-containing protein